MKHYDLLDPIQFQEAVENSGLSEGVLRAIRFGMTYGRSQPIDVKACYEDYATQQRVNKIVRESGNVVRLVDHKFKKSMEKLFNN